MDAFWENHLEEWISDKGHRRLACVVEDSHEAVAVIRAAWAAGAMAFGADDDAWATDPSAHIAVVGMPERMFSMALNRGYGVNPRRWPIHFGLLNSDTMWIMRRRQPVWGMISAQHKELGALNVGSNEEVGAGSRDLPIMKLYRDNSGSGADVENLLGMRRPPMQRTRVRSYKGGLRMMRLRDHLDSTVSVLSGWLGKGLPAPGDIREALLLAARHHDWGKAHPAFQMALTSGLGPEYGTDLWAKRRPKIRMNCKGFRHDLSGGCALVREAPLAAHLVLVHHGTFRHDAPSMSGDLPGADLGGGTYREPVMFSVKAAEWERLAGDLYGAYGPFVLGYMEALLRTADVQASMI